MKWQDGYSVNYYMTIVDKTTWKDIERFEITDGSVNRSLEGLRQSARVNCKGWDQDGEPYVRVYMDARQGDTGQRHALMTGLASVPQREYNGTLESDAVEIYSVLKPLEDIILPRGWYAAAGRSGAEVILSLMDIAAPVVMDMTSPTLSESIIAEENETNLSMVEKILNAINWRLRINGDGSVHITPQADTPSVVFDPLNADFIEPNVSVEFDWFSAPNVFMATSGSLSGIARDDDPNSPFSTVTRGREVWAEDTMADLNSGETIAEYAKRRLKEEQQISQTASYSRRFIPDVIPSDIVQLHYPAQKLQGAYKIMSQTIQLGFAARTTEGVTKIG